MKSKFDLTKQEKEKIMEAIKKYFSEERNEEIGDLASYIFMDYIANNVGTIFYNKGVKDAIAALNQKIDDLYELEKN